MVSEGGKIKTGLYWNGVKSKLGRENVLFRGTRGSEPQDLTMAESDKHVILPTENNDLKMISKIHFSSSLSEIYSTIFCFGLTQTLMFDFECDILLTVYAIS